jgi:hypothetical protein
MFKSQQYSLINYDCLPFQIQNYILKCDPFTKMLSLSNWPSPPTNRGPLCGSFLIKKRVILLFHKNCGHCNSLFLKLWIALCITCKIHVIKKQD